ncbi:uncharacterized protein C1orf122 homolog [Anas platyrhynchos]|uniref:uncharacterized protein C1orf122 homolog n=1 Tax=Anas platyrhynchos TaxID=8839 RepID=UPI003AF1F318
MATQAAVRPAGGSAMEAAGGSEPEPRLVERLRGLRSLLEARQRHLRTRIAACEELAVELQGLRAALGAARRSPPAEPAPGGRRALPAEEEEKEEADP